VQSAYGNAFNYRASANHSNPTTIDQVVPNMCGCPGGTAAAAGLVRPPAPAPGGASPSLSTRTWSARLARP
jgi:hypothetical protein